MMQLRILRALTVTALWIAGAVFAQEEAPFLLGPPIQEGPVGLPAGICSGSSTGCWVLLPTVLKKRTDTQNPSPRTR